ncbi:hypothetical protein ACTFIR_012875 [Dictyostelium discoideum]
MREIIGKLFGMNLNFRSVEITGKRVGAGVAGEWRQDEWGYPTATQEVIFLANVYQPKHVKRHPYHIVRGSIAPIMTTLPLAYFVLNYFEVISSKLGLLIALSSFIGGLVVWTISIIFDSLYDQQHTYEVKRGLVMGMMMFIISEVMFFFSFFWSYFYISLSPNIAIGCVWPPYGLTVYSYMGLPLLNTVLLLLSGAILTDGYTILTEQKAVHENNEKVIAVEEAFENLMNLYCRKKEIAISAGVKELRDLDWDLYFFENPENMEPNYKVPTELSVIEYALYFTLVCAVVFLFCQGYEYYFAPFSMNDGIYGSLFFLLTGFHGFHVLVGSILIGIITIRFIVGNFELLNVGTQFQIFKNKSTGFACTLFYWHFVDIVWIFLYIVIYWWEKRAENTKNTKKRPEIKLFVRAEVIKRVLTPKYDNIEYFIEQIEHYKIDDLEYAFLTRAQEAERREEEDEADIYLLDAIKNGYIWGWNLELLYPNVHFEEFFEIDFNHVPEWKVDGYGDFAFYGKDRMVKTKEYPKELPNENERREFELDFLLEKQ